MRFKRLLLLSNERLRFLARAYSKEAEKGTVVTTLQHNIALNTSRSILRVSGTDIVDFFQGLVTNDVSKLDNGEKSQIYCHLLNSKGRFLQDLFLHSVGDNTFVIDADASAKDQLKKILRMYSLRRGITIEDLSPDYNVWLCSDKGAEITAEAACEKQEGGQHVLCNWSIDPRLKELGKRGIFSKEFRPDHEVPFEVFQCTRMALGVAEGLREIPEGSISLEYNLDLLDGINFSKGCYIGQELMARTHFQGTLRKRLAPVNIMNAEHVSIKDGDELFNKKTGKKAGIVRAVCKNVGLALLRLEYAFENGEGQILASSQGLEVCPYAPFWWAKQDFHV
eukprot:jgi/Picsp_1/6492/NSC_03836-R1_protein